MGVRIPVIAICYDFDGTLAPGNMQEYDFFPELGIKPNKFWQQATDLAKKHSADPILAYMKLMIDKAKESAKVKITKKAFIEYGKTVELFSGVETWFDRINDYGHSKRIKIDHYIISSGIKEMIEGTKIKNKFEAIYSCSFFYDQHDVAEWPAIAVNYTTKTQFLFRINKGIKDISDNKSINTYVKEEARAVPFSRIIYIGDGDTDVPCMKLVKDKGGHSIAVYDQKKRSKITPTKRLLSDGRVNFVAEADYTEDSRIEKIVKAIIDDVTSKSKLTSLSTKPRPNRKSRPK